MQSLIESLDSLPAEQIYSIRNYGMAEVVNTYYKYEPIFNYKFLFKNIWLIEHYLRSIYPTIIDSRTTTLDENQTVNNENKKLSALLAHAVMSIVVNAEKLMEIMLSKRFENLERDKYQELVQLINDFLNDNEIQKTIPTSTPYDIPERDVAAIIEQWSQDAVLNIKNIINYLVNSLFQSDFATVYFTVYEIQRSAVWLACRYYSTDDRISRSVALKSELLSLLPDKESQEYKSFIALEKGVKSCMDVMEAQVIKAMNLVHQAT